MSALAAGYFRQSQSVEQQARRERLVTWSADAVVFLFGAALVLITARSFAPGFSVALGLVVVAAASWAAAPRVGLHLTVLFALTGDSLTIPWFPFNKNLSSQESVLYVADGLTTSPLELTLVFALACWFVRHLASRERIVVTGDLSVAFAVFAVFVSLGFLHGLATNGDLRIAIFEVRGLVYLPTIYFLVVNTCQTAVHYRRLLWTAMAGALGHALLSLRYLSRVGAAAVDDLESLGEHGATVPMNALFILTLATWAFVGTGARQRWALTAMCVPVMWVYVVSQRRAAVVGLVLGVLLLVIALAWRQRRTFWVFTPLFVLAAAAYTTAFWNITDGIGFGAQAIKAVIAPEQQTAADRQSDLYRIVENYDLNFTIRQSPVLGLGFGREFYRPIPLPNIGSLDLYRYMPHNSVLWIWIKMGFAGLVATLYLIGRAAMLGANRLRRAIDGADAAVLMCATAVVAMYTAYAFVDIAWDTRNMVLLGVAMAICASFPLQRPEPVSRAAERIVPESLP